MLKNEVDCRANDLELRTIAVETLASEVVENLQPYRYLLASESRGAATLAQSINTIEQDWMLSSYMDVRETKVLDPSTSAGNNSGSESREQEEQAFDWMLVNAVDRLYESTGYGFKSQYLQLRTRCASERCVEDSIAMVHALE